MGDSSLGRKRGLVPVIAAAALVVGVLATMALAAGPGGWDHLGDRRTPDRTRWTSSPRRWR